MLKSCSVILVIVFILTVIVWGFNYFGELILPANLKSGLVLFFLALTSVLGILAAFKETIELSDPFIKVSAELSKLFDRLKDRRRISRLAKKGALIVCVIPFENRGGESQFPSGYILDKLNQFNFHADVILQEIEVTVKTTSDANKIGEDYQAKLVIWGWYDTNGITTHISITDEKLDDMSSILEIQPYTPSDPDHHVLYVTKTLPETITFMIQSLVGQIYYYTNQPNKATEYFERALQINLPKKYQRDYKIIFHYLGTIYGRDKNDYKKAIEYFNKRIKYVADYSTYGNRGLTYWELGDFEKALDDFQKSIEINPQYMPSYYNRAGVFHALGDHEAAIKDYTRALEIKPNDVWSYNNRGLVYSRIGDFEKAIADFNKALDIAPKHLSSIRNRAALYLRNGDYRTAYKELKKARKYGLASRDFYAMRAQLWSDQKMHNLAIRDYSIALNLEIEDKNLLFGIYNNRGHNYYKEGRYKESISDYDKALKIESSLVTYQNRGLSYNKIGEYQKALDDFNYVLSKDHKNNICRVEQTYSYFMLKNLEAAKKSLLLIKIDDEVTETFVRKISKILEEYSEQTSN